MERERERGIYLRAKTEGERQLAGELALDFSPSLHSTGLQKVNLDPPCCDPAHVCVVVVVATR